MIDDFLWILILKQNNNKNKIEYFTTKEKILIFKEAMWQRDEETISNMLINDVMNLTIQNLATKSPYLKSFKRIIASGREIDLKFRNIKEANTKEHREALDFLVEFRKDPEKSLISLRSEFDLPGQSFFQTIYKVKIELIL